MLNQIYTLDSTTGGMLGTIIPIILMIAIFYFIGIRPQKKQEKEAQQMRDSLAVGDEITTIGGIVGKIVNKREDTIVIESGADRTKIKIATWAVRSVDKKFGAPVEESKPTTFKVKK